MEENHMSGLEWWYENWHWAFWIVVAAVFLRLVVRWIRISFSNTSQLNGLGGRVLRLRYLTGAIGKVEYKLRLAALRKLQSRTK
jgi:hypothetical protein